MSVITDRSFAPGRAAAPLLGRSLTEFLPALDLYNKRPRSLEAILLPYLSLSTSRDLDHDDFPSTFFTALQFTEHLGVILSPLCSIFPLLSGLACSLGDLSLSDTSVLFIGGKSIKCNQYKHLFCMKFVY